MSWTAQTLDCLCNLSGIEIDKPDVRDQTPLFAGKSLWHPPGNT